jgi:type IV secretion system protein VirB4
MLGTSDTRRTPQAASKAARDAHTARAARASVRLQRPRYWAQARIENPLARFVPLSSLVSPHDVITRGGDYLRVWRLDGIAFECADEAQVAERHEALCSLLRNLAGGQWAVWTHRLHRVVTDALEHPSGPGFAHDLSNAYQAKLVRQAMMSNELYLTLVYRPNVSRVSRALQSTQRSRAAIAEVQAQALRAMAERSALVDRVLRGFGPRLLGPREQRGRT